MEQIPGMIQPTRYGIYLTSQSMGDMKYIVWVDDYLRYSENPMDLTENMQNMGKALIE